MSQPAITQNLVWSQELQVHWPQSWRFLSARDVLLEIFRPKIFSVTDDTVFIRFGEDQDLRVSEFGLHIRLLTLASSDERIQEVFNQVLHIIEPELLHNVEAQYSHVIQLDQNYDFSRKTSAENFFNSWILSRPLSDYALLWNETVSPNGKGRFQVGVVDGNELIDRVAGAAATSRESLRNRLPAWMKVRMPEVALFMSSHFDSDMTFQLDAGRVEVPVVWRAWRAWSDELFRQLKNARVSAKEGEIR